MWASKISDTPTCATDQLDKVSWLSIGQTTNYALQISSPYTQTVNCGIQHDWKSCVHIEPKPNLKHLYRIFPFDDNHKSMAVVHLVMCYTVQQVASPRATTPAATDAKLRLKPLCPATTPPISTSCLTHCLIRLPPCLLSYGLNHYAARKYWML